MATSLGLSIQVSEPLVQGGNFFATLMPDAYTHTIQALGGYWSAQININLPQIAIEEWIENGLGRHIEIYNDSDELIFEGFVNQIEANIGNLAIQRGALLEVANRVNLTYSTIDWSTNPPTMGIRETTATTNDTDSQALYGIVQKYLSTGGSNDTIATQLQLTYLTENKDPLTRQSLNLSGGGLNLSLNILGYIHWSKTYVYNSSTTGQQDASTKIQNILGAELNSLFSTDYTGITENTTQVGAWEDDDDIAWELLMGIVALGDDEGSKWTLGMYQDRKVIYDVIPDDIAYQQRLSTSKIETITGQEVKPYNVLPGKWLFIPDFMIGRPQPTGTPSTGFFRNDPRNIFIESVTYRAPYELQIQGGIVDKLSQKLARLGISGIGG